MSIHFRSTLTLLKYINCLERVLFIDNKYMKDYEDIKNSVDREYSGVSLYLKKIIDSFKKQNLDLFSELPNRNDVQHFDGELECIILESINPSRYIPDDEKKTLVVIACPSIERVFHFKANCNNTTILEKSKLNKFFFHPQLSRIKLMSENFHQSYEKVDLKSLKFLYFLPSDADKINNSIKEFNGNFYLDNLVPDPAVGISIGSLSNYFIMPLMVIRIQRDDENLHQVILECKDWEGKCFNFHITVKLFKDRFGYYPEDSVIPFFIRGLIFQEFCEHFKNIIYSEQISENEFIEESFIAFVNFRKKVKKNEVPFIPKKIPNEIYENAEYYIYKPNGFDSEDVKDIPNYFEGKLPSSPNSLKKFQKYFRFHPDLKLSERSNITPQHIPIIIDRPNPVGLHRDILKESPLERLKFYCLHKRAIIFCTYCKSYKLDVELKNCPTECPNCGARVLTQLLSFNDDVLFRSYPTDEESKKRLEKYKQTASLFLQYREYAFFALATGFGIKRTREMLHRIDTINNIGIFFEKLLKIKQELMNKKDFLTILYRI